MPNGKNGARKTGKRRNRNRHPRTTVRGRYQRDVNNSILPSRFSTKLIYEGNFTTGAMTSTLSNQLMSVNSFYDPDYTGIGHQPRGFNEMSDLFGAYRVYASKIEVWFTITSNDSAFAGFAMQPVSLQSPSTVNGAMECRRTRGRIYGEDSNKTHYMKGYFPVHIVQGCKKQEVLTDDSYSAGVTGNPSLRPFVGILFGSPDQTTSTEVKYNVKMTMYGEFTAPKLLGQS